MAEIPEHLLRRSAEAKAKALGLPVEQVLAEMKGEAPPTQSAETPEATPPAEAAPAPVAVPEERASESPAEVPAEPSPSPAPAPAPAPEPAVAASGAARMAAAVAPRPTAPPEGVPEGVRTQRLLTVVKARAIQQVKAEPTDKVSTWPHLMVAEFSALMAITGILVLMSVVLQAPLLEFANFNATPNPSKAPWYFLGLQELLSYFDPQIAGVAVPGIIGLVGLMAIPYIDRNPSTKPSDRKLAIMVFTFFLMGAATLTIIGTFFRGPGFNFTYPWADGIWFDDLKDWVNFE